MNREINLVNDELLKIDKNSFTIGHDSIHRNKSFLIIEKFLKHLKNNIDSGTYVITT